MIDWFERAKAFVFVGTSFAVGITEHALMYAHAAHAPCTTSTWCPGTTASKRSSPVKSTSSTLPEIAKPRSGAHR